MKKAILFAALIFVVAAPTQAAPKAESAHDCLAYGMLALLARAAARHEVERAKFERIVADTFDFHNDDAKTIGALIVQAAYRAPDIAPEVYAGQLRGGCLRSGGDMDAFLGTGV